MSHSWRPSNSFSPARDYRPGGWDDGNRGVSWNAGNGGGSNWNEYEQNETFSEFREDVRPYATEEGDSQMYNQTSRTYYEDGRFSPIGVASVEEPVEYYIRDHDPTYPEQYERSTTVSAISREREWHAENTCRYMGPDEGPLYPSDNYEEGPCFQESTSWDLEQQRDLQGWRYEVMSNSTISVHSQSHSDSLTEDRSPESYMQHRDWSPGESRERSASYERRLLYEDQGHDVTQGSGRKRSPPFMESIPPYKRRRSFDSQENSIELTRDRALVKYSPNSSSCSEGSWLEPDHGREHGWSSHIRSNPPDISEERQNKRSSPLTGRGHRSLSPPRRGHPSMGRSYQGNMSRGNPRASQSYDARQEDYRREDSPRDDLRTRVPHRRSLSPHGLDNLKLSAPSRFRGSHHRSLSPHFQNSEGGLSKDRAQSSDLRQFLLKRGRGRSSEKSLSMVRDHGSQPRNSTSSEKEFSSSSRQLPTRSRHGTPVSDDSSNSRRCRKGHLKDKEDHKQKQTKKKKGEGRESRESPFPRTKSRNSDCSGSETSRVVHNKGNEKRRETSKEKGGKVGDRTVTLSENDGKRNKSKRATEQRDFGGEKDKYPPVKMVGSTASKRVYSASGGEEEQGPVVDVRSGIYSPIKSNDLEKEDAMLRAPADVKQGALVVVVDQVGRAVRQAVALDSVLEDSSQGSTQRVVLNSVDSHVLGYNPSDGIHQSAVLPRGRAHARGNASGRAEQDPVTGAVAVKVQHSVEAASTDKPTSEKNPKISPPSPVLFGEAGGSAVATSGTCAVSYGYTVTMEKKKTSARECDEAARDPDIPPTEGGALITQQTASSGKDISERVLSTSRATESFDDNLYMVGVKDDCKTAGDGNCELRINRSTGSEALKEISERPSSLKLQCGNHNQPENVVSRDAMPAPDTETDALPFGYSKTWNSSGTADRLKKAAISDESGDNVPTLDLTLGSDRIEVEPMELVDSNSEGQEEQLVPGEINSFPQESPFSGGHVTLDSSQRYSPSSPTKDSECEREGQLEEFVPDTPHLKFQTEQNRAGADTPGDFRNSLSGFSCRLTAVDEMAGSSRLLETQRERLARDLEIHGGAVGETCSTVCTEERLCNSETGANEIASQLKDNSATVVVPDAHPRHRPRVVYVSGVKRKMGTCTSSGATKQSSEHSHEELGDSGDSGRTKDVSQGSDDGSTPNKGSGRKVDCETNENHTKRLYVDAKLPRDCKGGLDPGRPNSAPSAAEGSVSEQNVFIPGNVGTDEPRLTLPEQGSFASTAGENASCMQLKESSRYSQTDTQDVEERMAEGDDCTNVSLRSTKTAQHERDDVANNVVPQTADGLQESTSGHNESNNRHTEAQKGPGCSGTHTPQVADMKSTWEKDTKIEDRDVEMLDSTEAEVLKKRTSNAVETDAQKAATQVEGSGEVRFLSVGIPPSLVSVREQECFERDASQSLKDPGLGAFFSVAASNSAADECTAQVTKATTKKEYRSCVEHGTGQVEKCGDSASSVQETENKRLRMINLRRKKDELEEVYRRECLTFIQVAKMMVSKDPSLENQLLQSVQQNLLEMGQRCVQELEEFARLETSKEWGHLLRHSDDVAST